MFPLNLGFMQGRLSPMENGKIQSFPWKYWQEEFFLSSQINLPLMEWTLDQEGLYSNPLLAPEGQKEILRLSKKFNLSIPSLTGDCFMQEPFWKAKKEKRKILENDFSNIIKASNEIGIKFIVVPLVDNGAVENEMQNEILVSFLESLHPLLDALEIKILFESDFSPNELKTFILQFNPNYFGINYDIGNSASLGHNPIDEFSAYGAHILNVHIKDRLYLGSTVPLMQGDANFEQIFTLLDQFNYKGNCIFQTARAKDNNHIGVMKTYINQIEAVYKSLI